MIISNTEEINATKIYKSTYDNSGNWLDITGVGYTVALNVMNVYVEIITPQFESERFCFLKLDHSIGIQENHSKKVRYALCTSDINKEMYEYNTCHSDAPSDEFQIITGSCMITSESPIISVEISKNDANISANTKYYLFLWKDVSYDNTGDGVDLLLGSGYDFPNFIIGYEKSVIHIFNIDKYDEYQCYIDSGVAFGLYVPYIDNGTSWEPL